jgi:hypothetical protein
VSCAIVHVMVTTIRKYMWLVHGHSQHTRTRVYITVFASGVGRERALKGTLLYRWPGYAAYSRVD